jgi:hypothetical protein
MTTENNQDEQKGALNKRLESISWALFLIMIGGIWLVPEERVPEGTWLIGVGVIMLGLNGARYLSNIKTSKFTMVLGILALIFGISDFFNVNFPFFPILLIFIGAKIIFKVLIKPLIEKKGKEKMQ